MLNLTREECRVILFLLSAALTGLGVNFALKVNSRIERFVKVDNNLAKIDLNQAKMEELLGLKGISPKLAEKIIAYRNQHGPFTNLEELKEIKGIGEYRYEKLRDLFFVD